MKPCIKNDVNGVDLKGMQKICFFYDFPKLNNYPETSLKGNEYVLRNLKIQTPDKIMTDDFCSIEGKKLHTKQK